MSWSSKRFLTNSLHAMPGVLVALHASPSLVGAWETLLRWRRSPWCRERGVIAVALVHRMMKFACGIEYDGTGYHGFQRQPEAHGPTIQGTLETAIARISGKMAVVHGAGRTDAGVHASGQVIHFSSEASLTPRQWIRALNAVLPESVAARWICQVPDSFHARYSASSRSY